MAGFFSRFLPKSRPGVTAIAETAEGSTDLYAEPVDADMAEYEQYQESSPEAESQQSESKASESNVSETKV